MFRGPGSKEVAARLSDGKDSVRERQRFGVDSTYVQHVRGYVADCPNSGSQQHRLRHLDENWLVSQFRWLTEQRAAGTEWAKIRRVLQACMDEVDVEIEREKIAGTITPDALMDVAKAEAAAGFYEDTATLDAVQHKTPGTLRQLADRCHAQAEALKQKARIALTLAATR